MKLAERQAGVDFYVTSSCAYGVAGCSSGMPLACHSLVRFTHHSIGILFFKYVLAPTFKLQLESEL